MLVTYHYRPVWRIATSPALRLPNLRYAPLSSYAREPLRILFCGSDELSCASLRAINQNQGHLGIASIDVLCRPGKPSGRGLKKVRDVPIKGVAEELGLRVHQRDTFTGWQIPSAATGAVNLLIAVSFGLFVPPRILKSVEYGGLNVHPSLLPDLRGPAPLHHTLLRGDSYLGVTLQTLDSEEYDRGKILLRRKHPIAVDDAGDCSYDRLLAQACTAGSELLVEGLEKAAYHSDYSIDAHTKLAMPEQTTHAPKITNTDREINFAGSSVDYIIRQDRALGRPWSIWQLETGQQKRLVFSGLKRFIPTEEALGYVTDGQDCHSISVRPSKGPGHSIRIWRSPKLDTAIYVILQHDVWLRVGEITIEGEKPRSAKHAIFEDDSSLGKGRGKCRFTDDLEKS